jgi:NAD(P)-dependent dehydrogenase (short-subunit alcohol dehydrogenase family)
MNGMAKPWTPAQIPALVGKTALVTGANSGIGYQAAVELARHGAHVVLGVRDVHKGHDALQNLLREAAIGHVDQGLTRPTAEIALLDLASLASIRNFALGFSARRQALDILINNAGVMALPTRQLTEDSFERQFGTNHLGHFALTGYMVPQLLGAESPRVVTVSSLAHRNGKIDFDNLQSERSYTPWKAYQNSKLANLLFAFELDRRARAVGSKLISIACHPGISQTNLVASGPGSDFKTNLLFGPLRFLTSPDSEGAEPTLYAAANPAAHSGEYIGPDGFMEFRGHPKVVHARKKAYDPEVAKRLWLVSEQLTGVTHRRLA